MDSSMRSWDLVGELSIKRYNSVAMTLHARNLPPNGTSFMTTSFGTVEGEQTGICIFDIQTLLMDSSTRCLRAMIFFCCSTSVTLVGTRTFLVHFSVSAFNCFKCSVGTPLHVLSGTM